MGFTEGYGPQVIGLRDNSKIENMSPYDDDFGYARGAAAMVHEHPAIAYQMIKQVWGYVPQAYETVISQ